MYLFSLINYQFQTNVIFTKLNVCDWQVAWSATTEHPYHSTPSPGRTSTSAPTAVVSYCSTKYQCFKFYLFNTVVCIPNNNSCDKDLLSFTRCMFQKIKIYTQLDGKNYVQSVIIARSQAIICYKIQHSICFKTIKPNITVCHYWFVVFNTFFKQHNFGTLYTCLK